MGKSVCRGSDPRDFFSLGYFLLKKRGYTLVYLSFNLQVYTRSEMSKYFKVHFFRFYSLLGLFIENSDFCPRIHNAIFFLLTFWRNKQLLFCAYFAKLISPSPVLYVGKMSNRLSTNFLWKNYKTTSPPINECFVERLNFIFFCESFS